MFWTTLGYAAAGADRRLAYYMSKPRTLLVDLRLDPVSSYAQWDGDALRHVWGKRYRQSGAYLGNINHASGGEISIPRLREGLEVLLDYVLEGWSLILLCGCMNLHECHRDIVRQEFSQIVQSNPLDISSIVEDTPEPGMMNCLSIKQPWAEIIMRAHLFEALEQRPKDVENRSWMTPWRGKLAIHAGATFDTGLFRNKIIDPVFWQDRFGTLAASLIPVHKDQYPLGAIIGVADLDAVLAPDAQELIDHPWYVPDQYGFVLKNIQPIDPIPWRGQRRLFQVPAQLFQGQATPATIYVDEIRTYDTPLPYKQWCHMATDGDIEYLHAFARRLALKPEWFQAKPKHPHYDLTPGKRAEAIKLGAIPVTSHELLERCWQPKFWWKGREE
jgi:hypothetical protein